MAANSVVKAVMDRYETFTAANFPSASRPPIYLDDAPVTDSAGAQEYQPYVALRDGGMSVEYDTEYNAIESSQLTLEVWADSLADADQIVNAIKYNGGTIAAGSGMDFGTLSFDAGRVSFQLVRTAERRAFGGIGKAGQRVYRCEIDYRAVVRRSL